RLQHLPGHLRGDGGAGARGVPRPHRRPGHGVILDGGHGAPRQLIDPSRISMLAPDRTCRSPGTQAAGSHTEGMGTMNDAKRTSNRDTVTLTDNSTGKSFELPILSGSTGPRAIDVSKLYGETGYFTYDPGFTSTASCDSTITYIDGDE